MNRALGRGVLFAVLVLGATAGHAHTLASTIVSVTMTHPDLVTITIAAEADPLIAKLEALAGVSASGPLTTARERRARIESLVPTLRAHIDARVASAPLVLDLQDVAVDDTAQTEIHLTARMPTGAPTFTWRSTFIFGAYRLSTRSGDAADAIEWLQGPQTSTPIALETPRAKTDGTADLWQYRTRTGHSLAMAALVIYVLGRRRASDKRRVGLSRTRYSDPRTQCRTISPGRSLPSSCTRPPRSSIWQEWRH